MSQRFGLAGLERVSREPILAPDPDEWFGRECVYNPAVAYWQGQYHMLYRAEGQYGNYISRIGLATSTDGVRFDRQTHVNPVIGVEGPFYHAESRGCEDPRLVRVGDRFLLTYTAWNGYEIRLSVAESQDLVSWRKLGPIVEGMKSGAILSQPVQGRYYMYLGDTDVFLATSLDLRHWMLHPEPVLRRRVGQFDSVLVEPGPPPFVTPEGILLLYNSSDGRRYRVGQALFDLRDPARLIARSDEPLLEPELDWEKYGKVNHVVFVEGAAEVGDGEYLVYYGGADKCIGVARGRLVA